MFKTHMLVVIRENGREIQNITVRFIVKEGNETMYLMFLLGQG